MAKAVAAYKLRTQMGQILRALGENERFVILRRNRPVGVLLSIHEYIREHPDQYKDVEDFIDTLLEESDPEFQRSLKRGAQEIRRGHYLSHTQLKLALANQRFR
jgi:PHD/YefM family antitoxin component YafN of YafNO toxin-antitoxin module